MAARATRPARRKEPPIQNPAIRLPASGPALAAPRPLPLAPALIYFALPALMFRVLLYAGLEYLPNLGLSTFHATIVAVTVPCAILFALACTVFKAEGHPLTWAAFTARLRLRPMTWREVLVAIAAYLIGGLGTGLLGFTALGLIARFPALAPPAFFPALLDPRATVDGAAFLAFVGEPLQGNWSVPLLYFVMLFFNIVGEELWWRGIILPRQTLVHGRWTWLIHGTLWALFHVPFYPWQLFALLPTCLALAWVAQRQQNTTAGLLMHTLFNGLPLVIALAGAFGLVKQYALN
jgi:membrane protease YdiL (CAAX protease family)